MVDEQMKPCLFKHRGLWYCITGGVVGVGFDPEQAYKMWKLEAGK